MERNTDDNWATIQTCIMNAEMQSVEQTEMPAFLKRVFNTAIDALRELVEAGIDLGDNTVVAKLQELILAICQTPQHRILAFDVSEVIKDFEEYEVLFYGYLSLVKQDAETSFTCDWVVERLYYMAENPQKSDYQKLEFYMDICEKLNENGSDKIRAYLARATENLAHSFMSKWMRKEAKKAWIFAIKLLSQDNERIIQREKRLINAQDNIKLIME